MTWTGTGPRGAPASLESGSGLELAALGGEDDPGSEDDPGGGAAGAGRDGAAAGLGSGVAASFAGGGGVVAFNGGAGARSGAVASLGGAIGARATPAIGLACRIGEDSNGRAGSTSATERLASANIGTVAAAAGSDKPTLGVDL